eukprot:1160729-Pelagomonas_calceolata.AAC.1
MAACLKMLLMPWQVSVDSKERKGKTTPAKRLHAWRRRSLTSKPVWASLHDSCEWAGVQFGEWKWREKGQETLRKPKATHMKENLAR